MAALADDWLNGGFGLYVHWPFCEAKCPYCDFNSHVSRNINQKQWLAAYLSELKRSAHQTSDRILNTIFFGGGTPSLMDPESVAAIIDTARALWRPANDMEITLEANPSSVEAGRFGAYRDAGVNRISMGIQALNDNDLRRLGRNHTVAEARAAFDVARDCFNRVSFDLIYARQHQSVGEWRAELSEALSMAVDHLSLYQLTIEDGTAFGDRYALGKLRGLPEEDSSADMYTATQEICEANGLPAYEVSNHARPGAESRHNLIYWRYGDYVGVGPGAHGRLTLGGHKFATETYLSPNAWLNAVSKGTGEKKRFVLAKQDQAIEYLMMCIRLTDGLDIERFNALSAVPLNESKIEELIGYGMVNVRGNQLSATDKGRAVLNAVIRSLLE
ncbi:radical SAM family heme chaperone HemW [Ruegeria arenilitoris]|uniref:radical SAM family heme chaperone HemW n=1 Tax=Ruegeria arenilitoris TaxID=1173585 RepID=UPI00147CBEA4|nr:radical SAM family heme chaperone HemW [Ruegeria arenilitoris]